MTYLIAPLNNDPRGRGKSALGLERVKRLAALGIKVAVAQPDGTAMLYEPDGKGGFVTHKVERTENFGTLSFDEMFHDDDI